ncbi:hypothetical protein CBS101457_004532 [Exobasidium rhododendri]|nr:hypothetical protein CBS101457_004532 [Exobasidium rhododendri]
MKQTRFLREAKVAPNKIYDIKAASEFDDLTAAPRNFSVSLLLTAVDSGVQCGPCLSFQPTYDNLATGFAKMKGGVTNRHMFAVLEFKNGREVFQKLALQYAPVLLYFPPTTGPHAAASVEPTTYDFNRLGFEGNDVAAELSKQLGVKVSYSKPFEWKLVGTVATTATIVISGLIFLIPKIAASGAFGLKTAWNFLLQAAVLLTIVVMCAGQMWNSIRNAPYMSMNQNGKPEYFAGGFQTQYGAETQIVAIVYAILAFSVVSLTVLVPMQRDPVKQRAGVYIWSAILLFAFSLLFYIFRIKNPSYPFRLFF